MIKGSYYNGKTSDKQDAVLYYKDEGGIGFVNLNTDEIQFDDVNVSSRIGNTPRYINFSDGSQFETDDNDAVDRMVSSLSTARFHGLAHKLESAKAFVLLTVVAVVLFGWLFIQFGIPYFSKEIAQMLPDEATEYMGQGVLEAMDKGWFSESQLTEQRQNELRQLFNKLQSNVQGDKPYKLEFRLGGKVKANAFALPNGVVVFTDELINLAENDMEVASVMLHEIGHLKHRHSIRATIQQFSLAMFVMVITGDVSTSSSIVTAIPVMLVESGFSQEMEWQADTYSLEYMLKHNIKPEYFSIMMEKLEASHTQIFSDCKKKIDDTTVDCVNRAVELNAKKDKRKGMMDYLSTHPASGDRVKRFRSAL